MNWHSSVAAVFDWISEGIGEKTIRRMAERTLKTCMGNADQAIAVLHFLHPNIDSHIEEAHAHFEDFLRRNGLSETPDPIIPDEPALTPEEPLKAPLPQLEPKFSRPSIARSAMPAVPEGVLISDRAAREVRAERFYAEDRFAEGISLLGSYRAMRLGHITIEAYREETRRLRFVDAPCFADPRSLRAFKYDYSVSVRGRTHVLDRHLKWGNRAVQFSIL